MTSKTSKGCAKDIACAHVGYELHFQAHAKLPGEARCRPRYCTHRATLGTAGARYPDCCLSNEAIRGSANANFLYLESVRDDVAHSFDCSTEDGGKAIVSLQEEGQVASIICTERR